MEINGVQLEVWLGLAAAIGFGALWALKKYQEINKDGKITLDEIIDTVEESEEHIDKIVEEVEKIEKELKARKCSVCGETGHNKRTCDKEDCPEDE